MDEKQKQIEEMATEIARIMLSCPLNQGRHCDCCKFNDIDTISYDCQSYLVAEKLLEKYQPKISENAVVLMKEEYDELQKGVKTYNYTAMFDAQSAYRWEQGYLQGRKETVDKFAERLKARLANEETLITMQECIDPYTGKDGFIYGYEQRETIEAIDEICKEITEG